MKSEFKDYFSDGSANYSAFRPSYPIELFSYLSSITQQNEKAWDCATGSGQSALALAKFFDKVIASDASHNQIANAAKLDNITYKVETAEQTSIANNCIDLITVAQALHWFDIDKFSREVNRVLKVNGVLAVWTYGLLQINPEINKAISHLYSSTLNSYWPPERDIVEQGYKNINFPFQELQPPQFEMELEWNLQQLIGYLCTWSAVKKFTSKQGENPVERLHDEILELWGDPMHKKLIHWPLILKVWIKKA